MSGWLVLGARGSLGSELGSLLDSRGIASTGADLPELDITDAAAVKQLIVDTAPDVVANAAAYTNVDGCEEEKDLSRRVNADAPGAVAGICRELGAKLVHISTDFVFDGSRSEPYTEDDDTNPLSEYGRGKLAGEKNVLEVDSSAIVLRTAWLYGRSGASFVEKMAALARKHESLRVVADQTGSPTYAADLASAVVDLVDAGARGLFHFANSGETNRLGLVAEVLRILGIDCELHEATTGEFPSPAVRPAYSVLDTSKFTDATGKRPPTWQDALERRFRDSG